MTRERGIVLFISFIGKERRGKDRPQFEYNNISREIPNWSLLKTPRRGIKYLMKWLRKNNFYNCFNDTEIFNKYNS